MPRFKPCQSGLKLIPVDFDRQIVPGSFEHALCYLIDNEADLSGLRKRFRNDKGGAPAFDPAVLLKIVLLGYSRGLVSSRAIAAACRENVLFMAVSGDSCPHFTTLAAFVSELGDEVAKLFSQVLLVCDRQGLIGRELFAIDGVKLPSNASKSKSGRRADFERQAKRMEDAVQTMLERQRAADGATAETQDDRATRSIARLKDEAARIRSWLADNPEDRKGAKGATRLSNRTDNESAKMATSKGVIQGYTGVASVDAKAQIILDAQAHGTGSEQELLIPAVTALQALRTTDTVICADAGYHSETNLKHLAEAGINAYICDNDYRQRDPRYADQDAHRDAPDPLWDKRPKPKKKALYKPEDFRVSEDGSHCICPAGKRLYRNGENCIHNGYVATKFQGAERDCVPCEQREKCLRKPDKTKSRQVAFFRGRSSSEETHTDRMKAKIDTPCGKQMITARFATVEPVFGNLRHNKKLARFTLRGRNKVDAQWKLYCMLHNIEKLAGHGYAR